MFFIVLISKILGSKGLIRKCQVFCLPLCVYSAKERQILIQLICCTTVIYLQETKYVLIWRKNNIHVMF